MVIDSSAVMAILRGESEAVQLLSKIQTDDRRLLSAATLVELQIVCARLIGVESLSLLQAFLTRFAIQTVSLDNNQAAIAGEAFVRFGKGRHPAGLNLSDCFTYALAKQTGEPLLFKGDDFSQTDLLLA